jgi:predicted DNA-binding ribbon-helix-helix protein
MGITKRPIGAAAVMDYFSQIANLLYDGNGGQMGALMKSSIVKRSIVIDGHKTSVSLEDPFWTDLKKIARNQQTTLSELISMIDGGREGNLSSAIRLFVLQHFRDEDRRIEATKAHAERTPASQP